MKIQMVDTVGQYAHISSEVDAAVLEVIRSGAFINGPAVHRFRDHLSAYLDVPYVIPCANGTDALQVALMALDLEPGDEVITPSFTYIATVEVISLLRLKPVFVEVDPGNFNMVAEDIEALITPRTKAIMPVHLYGQSAPMEQILEVARRHNLPVVEDTAQAIGSEYTFSDGRRMKAGTIGTIGTTSFYPSKNLGAYGDGGAILTRDPKLAERLQMICNHGSRERYMHADIGVNSRLDSVQAAILDVKLGHLDAYNDARRAAADRYDQLFGSEEGLTLPTREAYSRHVFHQYTLRVKAGRAVRDQLRETMNQAGIPTMIYYPLPIHLQPAYRHYGEGEGSLPITEQLTAEVISLPMHTELDEKQQAFIADHLLSALKQYSLTN